MKALLLISKDVGELSIKQQKAVAILVKTFSEFGINHHIDIEQVLNCEFCMGAEE